MRPWSKFTILFLCLFMMSTSYAWRELTVAKGDSLVGIAEKYHVNGVSRMDMVIALRDANPHVFNKTSSFKAGARLVVPTSVTDVRSAIKGRYPALSKVASANGTSANAAKAPLSVKVPANKTAANDKSVPKPAPSVKKVATSTATGAASVAATTIKSLQDTVSSQTAAIQNYQGQLNQLNGQLNIANQQVQSLQKQGGGNNIWSLGNLWLTLWLVTLAAFLWQYRKYKNLLAEQNDDIEDEEADLAQEDENELDAATHEDQEELDEEGRMEPHLATEEIDEEAAAAVRPISENWEQVELDIPAAETAAETELPELSDLDYYEQEEEPAPGSQQDIIEALAQHEDNMEWHQALLEFYVKTNSQNGFKRHYQTMIKNGLLIEGDALWEEVRKMYLNKWIYETI
jgi:hypothetical protein